MSPAKVNYKYAGTVVQPNLDRPFPTTVRGLPEQFDHRPNRRKYQGELLDVLALVLVLFGSESVNYIYGRDVIQLNLDRSPCDDRKAFT